MFLHQAPLASASLEEPLAVILCLKIDAQQMQIFFDKFELFGHYTQGLAYFALDVEYLQTQKSMVGIRKSFMVLSYVYTQK